MVPLGLLRVEVTSRSVLLPDDVLHQRQQSVDVHLLTRLQPQVRQRPFCHFGQRLSYSLYVLMEGTHQALNKLVATASVSLLTKTQDCSFSHLDDCIRSDVLYLLLSFRVLWRGHLPSLAPP